jgi:hypothetical protein
MKIENANIKRAKLKKERSKKCFFLFFNLILYEKKLKIIFKRK